MRAPKLSPRLTCVSDMVAQSCCETLADVGCDHALLPIALLVENRIDTAVASDVREGPLARAKKNAARYGVENRLRLVLGDGLSGIQKGEAEALVVAGMGGELICAILDAGDAAGLGVTQTILSPHTKAETLRAYLRARRLPIVDEKMVFDDGKFYPVVRALTTPQERYDDMCERALTARLDCDRETARRITDRFGPCLLQRRDETLTRYLIKRKRRLQSIVEGMCAQNAVKKRNDVEAALSDTIRALTFIKE